MVLAWENLQEVFVMLVVVVVFCFFFIGGFYISRLLFLAIGTPRWLLRLVKASTSPELYPGYFWLLYFFQVFLSQFYRERYGFECPFFTHRRFLPYASSPTFLARFCDSDAGRNTPSRIFLCACPCSYKTIDLSIAQMSHEE